MAVGNNAQPLSAAPAFTPEPTATSTALDVAGIIKAPGEEPPAENNGDKGDGEKLPSAATLGLLLLLAGLIGAGILLRGRNNSPQVPAADSGDQLGVPEVEPATDAGDGSDPHGEDVYPEEPYEPADTAFADESLAEIDDFS